MSSSFFSQPDDENYYETQDMVMHPAQVHSNRMPPAVHQGQSAIRASAVHGKGMWNNFLRSFSDPLYALLDLFDNAVDASWNIPSHKHPKIKVDIDRHGQNGIYIRNAASDPIPHMSKILEVFRSTKVHDKAAVGENGVGIKHACANLSDLSLVLTKTADAYSLGVLMKELQGEVPHFPHLVISKSADIYRLIKETCEREPNTWGKATELYGDGDMYQGVDRIDRHFREMKTGADWKDFDEVFTIIITKLRQTGHSEGTNDEDDIDDLSVHGENEGDERSSDLLKKFVTKLPQLYIHLNENIQVHVCGRNVDMAYWETRLANLTRFEVGIPQEPETDPTKKLTHHESPYAHPTVRFWFGFNVQRPSASAHIYYYSRQSGRLIKDLADCRSMLKLVAGSTDFKQGLTIIVDDLNSTLPLNPTKQDLSFAFREHGDTHKTNLNAWLSGITHFYWNYYFDTIAKKSKRTLTSAVAGAAKLLEDGIESRTIRPLSSMEPIHFRKLKFSLRLVKEEDEEGHDASYTKLFVNFGARQSVQEVVGQDTLVQLSDVDLRRVGAATRKRKKSTTELSRGKNDSDEEEAKSPPRKKKATARKSLKKSTPTVGSIQELETIRDELFAKETELLESEKEKTEKDKEIRVLRKENRKLRKVVNEVCEQKEKEVLEIREDKDKEINELLDEKKNAEKEVLEARERLEEQDNEILELREALEAAKKANGGIAKSDDKYSLNVRIENTEKHRSAYMRVPAEANRSIYSSILLHAKIKENKILGFDNKTLGKLESKAALLKVGIWDPSREKGDYSYVYDFSETKNETTLQLFNFLNRDGVEVFRGKYDPLHLYIFAQDKPVVEEDEGEFII